MVTVLPATIGRYWDASRRFIPAAPDTWNLQGRVPGLSENHFQPMCDGPVRGDLARIWRPRLRFPVGSRVTPTTPLSGNSSGPHWSPVVGFSSIAGQGADRWEPGVGDGWGTIMSGDAMDADLEEREGWLWEGGVWEVDDEQLRANGAVAGCQRFILFGRFRPLRRCPLRASPITAAAFNQAVDDRQ